jgi:hypothetical protein
MISLPLKTDTQQFEQTCRLFASPLKTLKINLVIKPFYHTQTPCHFTHVISISIWTSAQAVTTILHYLQLQCIFCLVWIRDPTIYCTSKHKMAQICRQKYSKRYTSSPPPWLFKFCLKCLYFSLKMSALPSTTAFSTEFMKHYASIIPKHLKRSYVYVMPCILVYYEALHCSSPLKCIIAVPLLLLPVQLYMYYESNHQHL